MRLENSLTTVGVERRPKRREMKPKTKLLTALPVTNLIMQTLSSRFVSITLIILTPADHIGSFRASNVMHCHSFAPALDSGNDKWLYASHASALQNECSVVSVTHKTNQHRSGICLTSLKLQPAEAECTCTSRPTGPAANFRIPSFQGLLTVVYSQMLALHPSGKNRVS